MAEQKNLTDRSKGKALVSQAGGGFVHFLIEKALMGINSVGSQAMDDVKIGVDSAWKELKAGIDSGLDSATDGIRRGWQEFSGGVDRALDGFMNRKPRSANS